MRRSRKRKTRVLAIHPSSKGFGYAVFESPEQLVDWGLVYVRERTVPTHLKRIVPLLERYKPSTIVLEDPNARACRRGSRVKRLLRAIIRRVGKDGLQHSVVTRSHVRVAFSRHDARTKHQIATVIAKHFPELAPRLPAPRKPWMSEDQRMTIFSASAIGLSQYVRKKH